MSAGGYERVQEDTNEREQGIWCVCGGGGGGGERGRRQRRAGSHTGGQAQGRAVTCAGRYERAQAMSGGRVGTSEGRVQTQVRAGGGGACALTPHHD